MRIVAKLLCAAVIVSILCGGTVAQDNSKLRAAVRVDMDSAQVIALQWLAPADVRAQAKATVLSDSPEPFRDSILNEAADFDGVASWTVSIKNVQLSWKDKFDTSEFVPTRVGHKDFVIHVSAVTGSVLKIESPYIAPGPSLPKYPWKEPVSLWLNRGNWSARLSEELPPATLIDVLNCLASRRPSAAQEIIAYPMYMKWIGNNDHLLESDLPSDSLPFWYVVTRYLDAELTYDSGAPEMNINGECTLFQKLDITHPRASDLETLYGSGTLSPL